MTVLSMRKNNLDLNIGVLRNYAKQTHILLFFLVSVRGKWHGLRQCEVNN